ncbi:MAG: hypothetical protein ACYDAY_11365 [Candidatus Dormibacteria bacterium]
MNPRRFEDAALTDLHDAYRKRHDALQMAIAGGHVTDIPLRVADLLEAYDQFHGTARQHARQGRALH